MSSLGSIQASCSLYNNYGFDDDQYQKFSVYEAGDSSEKTGGFVEKLALNCSNYSPLSSPSSTNSSGGYNVLQQQQATNYQPEEAHNSLINFKAGAVGGQISFMHSGGSLLSFVQNEPVSTNQDNFSNTSSHQEDDYLLWENNHLNNNFGQKCTNPNLRFLDSFNSYQTACVQENGTQVASYHKRPSMGENLQALKKQCTIATKKAKPAKSSEPAKDPQSVAAKNRRERISDRLKTLQELVPNGSKVDLVTMLEKAISYVKFLQLQVKVLATDEFWPVQGGKAPDISQVKEAIDAILSSSQRDRNSSSSK